MNCRKFIASVLVTAICVIAFAGTRAIAEPSKDAKPGAPEMKLPAGWTMEDVQACAAAGTPGKMHEYLAKGVGTWDGKNTMWMAPDTDPIKSESVTTVMPMMDGRFFHIESKGDMPGMGPFHGAGLYGFDNVSQKFQGVWVDNMGTGMMTGTGELSSDGKTLTWNYTYNCPIQKKPVTMREVETITGPNTKTLEMFAVDPKSGKEFKMMLIEFTKKS